MVSNMRVCNLNTQTLSQYRRKKEWQSRMGVALQAEKLVRLNKHLNKQNDERQINDNQRERNG